MRPFRSTLWATLVFGALLVVYAILAPRQQKKQDLEEQQLQILNIEPSKISAFHIESWQGKLSLTRTDGEKHGWSLTEPLIAPASKEQIQALLQQVDTLKAKRLITEKATELSDYGLKKPPAQMTVDFERMSQTLLFGNRAAVGQDYYLKIADKDPVYLVDKTLLEKVVQPAEAFRDRSVWTFDPASVTVLSVKKAKKSWQLKRVDTDKWFVASKQGEKEGDPKEIERLLIGLRDLRIDRFLADHVTSKEIEEFGFNRPDIEVTIQQQSGPEVALLISHKAHARLSEGQISIMPKGGRFIYSLGRYFVDNLDANPAKYETHGS